MFNKKPQDDKNYLVSWFCPSERSYCSWHRAYWWDGKFFSLESHHAFPLDVDVWVEMPKLPSLGE